MSRLITVIAAASGLALIAGGAFAQEKKKAAGGCFLAGGEATMLTGDLARFMANAALSNSIKGANARPSGQVRMTCKDGMASVYCKAEQRACR